MSDAILPRLKVMFLGAIGLLIAGLFFIGVGLRTQEIALVSASARFLSTLSYRIEYAAGGGLASAGAAPGEPAAQAATNAQAVPVLLYHGIVQKADRFSLTTATFKDQMFALKRAGYQTISLADFLAFEKGKELLPDKSFLLTFDDGRRDSYENADPVLAALGYTAVMFVATEDSLDDPKTHNDYYLTKDELASMQASGRWEIGSHLRQVGGGFVPLDAKGANGNFLSNRTWLSDMGRLETNAEYAARVKDELAGGKERLTNAFGGPITAMSYPFGDYGQQEINAPNAEAVISAEVHKDYDMAFEQVWDVDNSMSENYPGEDQYHFRRIEVDTGWSGQTLVSFLASVSAKTLPFEKQITATDGWKHDWGTLAVHPGSLTLSASSTSSGADAFLDGSGTWTNYRFTAALASRTSESVSLVVRYADANHYALCTFYDDRVKVEERIGASSFTITDAPAPLPAKPVLGVSVNGNAITCFAGGKGVASGNLPRAVSRGGVGLRIWDPVSGRAHASFESLTVLALSP